MRSNRIVSVGGLRRGFGSGSGGVARSVGGRGHVHIQRSLCVSEQLSLRWTVHRSPLVQHQRFFTPRVVVMTTGQFGCVDFSQIMCWLDILSRIT